jgi:hypothetical protein
MPKHTLSISLLSRQLRKLYVKAFINEKAGFAFTKQGLREEAKQYFDRVLYIVGQE